MSEILNMNTDVVCLDAQLGVVCMSKSQMNYEYRSITTNNVIYARHCCETFYISRHTQIKGYFRNASMMRDSCKTLDENCQSTNTRIKHFEVFDIFHNGSTETNIGTALVSTNNSQTCGRLHTLALILTLSGSEDYLSRLKSHLREHGCRYTS